MPKHWITTEAPELFLSSNSVLEVNKTCTMQCARILFYYFAKRFSEMYTLKNALGVNN